LCQVSAVFEDCIHNIISDVAIRVHREMKLARMQSAAIIAQQTRETAKSTSEPDDQPLRITTAGAIITEEEKIYLHGNPLKTTEEELCPTCWLPRLFYPTTGASARPRDPNKQYCSKEPYITKPGCDIYGRSLNIEKPSKSSKAKDAKSKNAPSPRSSESPSATPGPDKQQADKPAATPVPQTKCPNCPRYMAFTRVAQHMSRCMNISGRRAGQSKPDSRASTPIPTSLKASQEKPANNKKRKLEKESEDEGEEATPKKKKLVQKRALDSVVKPKAINSNIQRVKDAGKRLPGQTGGASSPPPKGSGAEKRPPKRETVNDEGDAE
jgi:hypothetical protein